MQDRREIGIDAWLKLKVDESFADPRPSVPARDVFRRLRAYHETQARADSSKS
jgi:antitoxin ParD1/3/4